MLLYNLFPGSNCIDKIKGENFQPDFIPFSCQLSMTGSELSVSDLFSVTSVFDSKSGK